MNDRYVKVAWDAGLESSKVLVAHDGTGQVDVPKGAKEFMLMPGPKVGKEPGRIAYQNCSVFAGPLISLDQVLQKGLVPENRCGKKSVAPLAGEVVFWALPLKTWIPDFQ